MRCDDDALDFIARVRDAGHRVRVLDVDIDSTETTTYLHTDHLSTPRLGTDQPQAAVWRWESTAFGMSEPTGSAEINLRFPGQYDDEETGLHYNWYRHYDPQTGRYIASDPIGISGGLNTYAYVGGNPTRFQDPLGLEVWELDQFPQDPTTINIGGGLSGVLDIGGPGASATGIGKIRDLSSGRTYVFFRWSVCELGLVDLLVVG